LSPCVVAAGERSRRPRALGVRRQWHHHDGGQAGDGGTSSCKDDHGATPTRSRTEKCWSTSAHQTSRPRVIIHSTLRKTRRAASRRKVTSDSSQACESLRCTSRESAASSVDSTNASRARRYSATRRVDLKPTRHPFGRAEQLVGSETAVFIGITSLYSASLPPHRATDYTAARFSTSDEAPSTAQIIATPRRRRPRRPHSVHRPTTPSACSGT